MADGRSTAGTETARRVFAAGMALALALGPSAPATATRAAAISIARGPLSSEHNHSASLQDVSSAGRPNRLAADPSTTPNWIAESNVAAAWLGRSAAPAGDVNGDHYADVIVGAPEYADGQTTGGAAFVYQGSVSGLAPMPNWRATAGQEDSDFGYSAGTAGDVNGDGYADVIIGAPSYTTAFYPQGLVFVYHGSASGLSPDPDWAVIGDDIDGYFGRSVGTAGDVNGDGFSDVVVGAPGADLPNLDGSGRVFVYHGSALGLSRSPDTILQIGGTHSFGQSVRAAGDVNRDGFADVVVGTPDRADVFLGSEAGLSLVPNWTALSDQSGAGFGEEVGAAGDVNGDGYDDIVVGAPRYNNGQDHEGRAYVYHGSPGGPSHTANWVAESNQFPALFGSSVGTAGDVNSDGYADLVVGAIWYTNGQRSEGRAFVFYGSASGLSLTANWTADSNQAEASFGASVGTAGDVNGDGSPDLIIGAPEYSNGQQKEGRAYVFHSAPGSPPNPTATPSAGPSRTPRPTPGNTRTLSPDADAYVTGENPHLNFGAGPLGTDRLGHSYLRFVLPNTVGRTVRRAVLWVYANESSPVGYRVCQSGSDSWNERYLTYGYAPSLHGDCTPSSGPHGAGQYASVDVTEYVPYFYYGSYSFTLAMVAATQDAPRVSYLSREAAANRPYLVVDLGPEATATPIPSETSSAGPSAGPSRTPTASPTGPRTASPPLSRTPTASPTTLPTTTPSPTPSRTALVTATPSPTPSRTALPTPTPSPTVTPANDPPSIAPVPDVYINNDGAWTTVGVLLSDVDTALDQLTLSAASDAPGLVDAGGLSVSGNGARRTLTLAPIAGRQGSATVTLTASDGSASSQRAFMLKVGQLADLSVSLSDGIGQVSVGQLITFTLVVSNAGPHDVNGATVTNALPAGLSSAAWSCQSGPGAVCSAAGAGPLLSDQVSLDAGQSITYTLRAVVAGPSIGALVNSAEVAAPPDRLDPPGNNSATDVNRVGFWLFVPLLWEAAK